MTALLIAGTGALGTHLLVGRLLHGHRNLGLARLRPTPQVSTRWLQQAGLVGVRWREFLAGSMVVALAAFLVTFALFGGAVPSALAAGIAACGPAAAVRHHRNHRLAVAHDTWPRLVDELRVLITNTGASIPRALFEVGGRCPAELARAFELAQRDWLLTTDFASALATLKQHAAHASADMVCETLLVAYTVGGIDLDRRLSDLADDRQAERQARKDARATQAGARFARVFVLLVPLGMALVGLSIGRGRAAYASPSSQLLVAVGISVVAGCWWWAGRIMHLPPERRVFAP